MLGAVACISWKRLRTSWSQRGRAAASREVREIAAIVTEKRRTPAEVHRTRSTTRRCRGTGPVAVAAEPCGECELTIWERLIVAALARKS
jgi:hypothetical protein